MPIEGHENREYSSESQRLTTSEAARRWTETSPRSKLVDIAEKLANYNWDDAEDLRKLIENWDYREFQKRIWIKWFKDLDWKLWPKTLDFFNNYLGETRENYKVKEKTDKKLKNLQDSIQIQFDNDIQYDFQDRTHKPKHQDFQDYVHRPEFQQLTDSAKIHKNAKEYLSRHESLSEDMYNRLFSWKESLQQWQIWNCTMVTALIELSNTQYFDTLVRTSISRVQFKDDNSTWYNIRLPLWEPNGRDILIKDSELDTAKINWSIGYKLLEIAYVKSRRLNNTEWNKYSPVTEWEYTSIVWLSVEEAFRTFIGKNNIWFSNFGTFPIWKNWKTLAEASESQKTEMTNYLKNYNWNIWNSFTCLTTAPSPRWDAESFEVSWKTFWKNHAYALDSVEKDSNWDISYINVKNPWNNNELWGSSSRLTLDEFFKTFSYMWVWKVKIDTFLDNEWYDWA